ncbi:MAG: hypothetical protein WD267_01250 [Balneolales bacterium]
MDYQARIRRLFIFFLIFLPAQYALVGVMGYFQINEHWPGFVFPGFKNVFDGADGISLEEPYLMVTLSDGSKKQINVPDLLSEMPYSHHKTVMARRFHPEAIEILEEETKVWLYQKLSGIVNDREVINLEIEWRLITYQILDGEVNTGSELISRNIINFHEEV